MKRCLLYLLLLLAAQPVFATSIVVLITPDYILLGADSRRTILNAHSEVVEKQSVCKIKKAGTYCFALAGLVASKPTSFSADSIVSSNLKYAVDYEAAIKNITLAITEALQKEILFQKQNQPASYIKTVASKEHILEVVILSVKDAKPQVNIIGFELTDVKKGIVRSYASSCPGDCPAQKKQFYFVGEYKGMENYLGAGHDLKDPVTLVEQLIVAQSKLTPTSVAAPVSLVKFTNSGIEWLK